MHDSSFFNRFRGVWPPFSSLLGRPFGTTHTPAAKNDMMENRVSHAIISAGVAFALLVDDVICTHVTYTHIVFSFPFNESACFEIREGAGICCLLAIAPPSRSIFSLLNYRSTGSV